MDLNYLLSQENLDETKTPILVMRHTPMEPHLRRALPWLAAGAPDVFNAYQQSQGPSEEKQLTRAAYLASFIGRERSEASFAGLYEVVGHRPISYDEFWNIPANQELRKLGVKDLGEESYRSSTKWFNLRLTNICADWKGKLIISWPPPAIKWARWANQSKFKVKAILEESVFDKGMPDWYELLLTWEELHKLPKSWVDVLSGWRGVYFILDGANGKGYVGSAYGAENLYGRWSNYAASGDGGNIRLRQRTPDKFRFSILELVSPTARPDDVIQCEKHWKDRLHTREFGLNAN